MSRQESVVFFKTDRSAMFGATFDLVTHVGLTDLYTWIAGRAEKVSSPGRHLGNGKKPS